MGKIISIVNQKGGVGKTTTTVNLGASLTIEKQKVLLIDFDQQANATISLGINREDINYDIVDILLNSAEVEEVILKTNVESLDIIPASIRLSQLEDLLYNTDYKEWILYKKIENLKNKYRKNLNANYNFNNFVVGQSNMFAFRMAMKVADQPGAVANPFYIFGSVGLGKTHLMMAIGHYILDNNLNNKSKEEQLSFANSEIGYLKLIKIINIYLMNISKVINNKFFEFFY